MHSAPLRLTAPVTAFALGLFLVPSIAAAQPPDPALIVRLGHHIEAIEAMGKRASVHLEALTEELDGDGKVSSTATQVSRIEADGKTAHEVIERSMKDGKDVTAEEQEKTQKAEAERAKKEKKKDDDEEIALPFKSDGYLYDQVNVDSVDPARIEISFTPKKPGKHFIEGKAWVDATSGTILSAGAKLSKPPAFVDWVHFTVELGEKTSLGPAISRLTFEGKGGLLFIRKHFRGEVKMTGYRIAPAPAP